MRLLVATEVIKRDGNLNINADGDNIGDSDMNGASMYTVHVTHSV
jgi:hypothetical protein